ncbi:MAG: hypothetical protein C5B49_13250 [Bdellovibrio sp.]|nr:MAG: hypothetical protein C5B49_13250 [Bdellovibrio sp.]
MNRGDSRPIKWPTQHLIKFLLVILVTTLPSVRVNATHFGIAIQASAQPSEPSRKLISNAASVATQPQIKATNEWPTIGGANQCLSDAAKLRFHIKCAQQADHAFSAECQRLNSLAYPKEAPDFSPNAKEIWEDQSGAKIRNPELIARLKLIPTESDIPYIKTAVNEVVKDVGYIPAYASAGTNTLEIIGWPLMKVSNPVVQTAGRSAVICGWVCLHIALAATAVYYSPDVYDVLRASQHQCRERMDENYDYNVLKSCVLKGFAHPKVKDIVNNLVSSYDSPDSRDLIKLARHRDTEAPLDRFQLACDILRARVAMFEKIESAPLICEDGGRTVIFDGSRFKQELVLSPGFHEEGYRVLGWGLKGEKPFYQPPWDKVSEERRVFARIAGDLPVNTRDPVNFMSDYGFDHQAHVLTRRLASDPKCSEAFKEGLNPPTRSNSAVTVSSGNPRSPYNIIKARQSRGQD